MGEGTNGVTPPDPTPDELVERVEHSRARLDSLVAQLDERRHVVTNIKRRVSEQPLWFALGAAAFLGLTGGAIMLATQRARHQRTLLARLARMTDSVGRSVGQLPDYFTALAPPPPSLGKKVLAAAATGLASSVASLLVKRLAESAVVPALAAGPPTRALPEKK